MTDQLPMAVERQVRAGEMFWGNVSSFICLTLLSVGYEYVCLHTFGVYRLQI